MVVVRRHGPNPDEPKILMNGAEACTKDAVLTRRDKQPQSFRNAHVFLPDPRKEMQRKLNSIKKPIPFLASANHKQHESLHLTED